MRVLCLLLAIASLSACASRGPSGPAWPKPHDGDGDGGESLAPRLARSFEPTPRLDDGDDHPVAVVPPAAPAVPATAPSAPAAAAAAPPGEPQVIETDEIVIEVDD